MLVTAIKTSLFKNGRPLFDFIVQHVPPLHSGDLLVVTSKIVALSEGRVARLADKQRIIAQESREVIETPWAFITCGADGWSINAGVDASNADGQLVLLPRDTGAAAAVLCVALKKRFRIKKLGVIITDTRSVPLRVGTIGRALGYAGFEPLKSYIGKKDLFGRTSRVTQSNHADALAAAAVLVMGEGNERCPLAVISGAPVLFTAPRSSKRTIPLALSPELDIFSYVFAHVSKKKKRQK